MIGNELKQYKWNNIRENLGIKIMQIMDRIKSFNGCSACIMTQDSAIKMEYDGEKKFPLINEGACSKCNN